MRKLVPFFLVVIALAALAGWRLDISRIFSTLQPVSVILSIMAAAIFVRLNRGMPTIDWKALTADERKRITERIVGIAGDYIVGLVFSSCSILTLVCFVALGPQQAAAMLPEAQSGMVAWFILIVGTSLIWMGYVVWRDYDIVLLQSAVIDAASIREQHQKDVEAAAEKTASIKASAIGVAPTPVRPFQSN